MTILQNSNSKELPFDTLQGSNRKWHIVHNTHEPIFRMTSNMVRSVTLNLDEKCFCWKQEVCSFVNQRTRVSSLRKVGLKGAGNTFYVHTVFSRLFLHGFKASFTFLCRPPAIGHFSNPNSA